MTAALEGALPTRFPFAINTSTDEEPGGKFTIEIIHNS